MSHDEPIATLTGEVADIFAHRFVLRTADGPALIDLGPKGAETAALTTGERITVTGRKKPSELKVATLTRGGTVIEIDGGKARDDHDHEEAPADPAAALAGVAAEGHEVVAEPRRKPKHFEILARDKAGAHHEHHVTLDGHIRKTKSGDPADHKWRPLPPKAA